MKRNAEKGNLKWIMEIDRDNVELNHALGEELNVGTGVLASTMCSDLEVSESDVAFSMNRSGRVRKTNSINHAATHTEYVYRDALPILHGCRNFNASIKIALASSRTVANISSNQARLAFQIVSEIFFKMKYYLSPSEVQENMYTETITSTSDVPLDPPSNKRPRSKQQYVNYECVLPSKKSIDRMKQLMAIQEERNAALALLDGLPDEVMTVKYDTTSRRRLNGEWPSIILKSSSGKKYRLRSLHMSLENRQNIVQLFLATLGRLEIAGKVDSKVIWSKIGAITTDSVSKNLQIEHLIAASFSSTHIPLHLLCTSHTSEAFDNGNLSVLTSIENKIEMKKNVLLYLPFLKSFLSKGVTQAAINTFCKLTINDGSKSSLHGEFDYELEKKEGIKEV